MAENRESCLTCLCAVATFGVGLLYWGHHSWELRRPGLQYFAKGAPSVNRAPNDYAAICHTVSNALKTLRDPPYRPYKGDKLLQLFY